MTRTQTAKTIIAKRINVRGVEDMALLLMRRDREAAERAEMRAYPAYARTADDVEDACGPCGCSTCVVYGGECPSSLRMELLSTAWRRWARKARRAERR